MTQEIAFTEWLPTGGVTDLQALAIFDTMAELGGNGDGVLSSKDTVWSELRVWQDVNSNGITDSGELKTLTSLGFTKINLTYDDGSAFDDNRNDVDIFGNKLMGTASYTRNGQVVQGGVGDVSLQYSGLGWRRVETAEGHNVEFEIGTTYRYAEIALVGNAPDMAAGWYDGVAGDENDNYANGSSVTKSLSMSGGAGNDTLIGGAVDDFISGDEGSDSLVGGGGNDTLFADADDVLDGGLGYDVVVGIGEVGIEVDLVLADVEAVYGSEGNDTLRGKGAGNDDSVVLYGRGGDDILTGSRGGSVLSGDEGNDTLNAVEGSDLVLGGTGDDFIVGLSLSIQNAIGTDTIFGGAGNDTVDILNYGDNLIFGGDGEDSLTGGYGDDSVSGDDGHDTIRDLGGDNTLSGGNGNDKIFGGDGDEIISGGGGNDTIWSSQGDDWIEAGEGDDRIWQRGHAHGESFYDVYFGGNGTDELRLDGLQSDYDITVTSDGIIRVKGLSSTGNVIFRFDSMGIEAFIFSDGTSRTYDVAGGESQTPEDYVALSRVSHTSGDSSQGRTHNMGSSAANSTHGRGGDDYMDGNGRDDTLWGESGDDTIKGGDDDDSLLGGSGADSLNAGSGTDAVEGGSGADSITGGALNDWINGSSGADTIWGGTGSDVIDAGSGDDVVFGWDENTFDPGDDRITLGGGNDFALGGYGNDTIKGDDGDDTIQGDAGDDSLWGGYGDDLVLGGDGNDFVVGEYGNDSLFGDAGNDTINGWGGFDRLFGGEGNDSLNGGGDDDQLYGETGADTLFGHLGNDYLEGGAGADVIDGAHGIDAASYRQSAAAVNVDLTRSGAQSGGDAAGDTLVDIENLIGSALCDTLVGNSGHNLLSGGDGADSLDGGQGHDWLIGDHDEPASGQLYYAYHDGGISSFSEFATEFETAPDGTGFIADFATSQIASNHGDDSENYVISFNGVLEIVAAGTYTFHLNTDDASQVLINGTVVQNHVGANQDKTFSISLDAGEHQLELRYRQYTGASGITLEVKAPIEGSSFVSLAESGLLGNARVSTRYAGRADDTLTGGDGHDRLEGGSGADLLDGGEGDDTLGGGSGADVFEFSGSFGQDLIADFETSLAGEVIDLSGVAAITSYADLTENHLSSSGSGAVISDGHGNTITLAGIATTELGQDSFVF